MAVCTQRGDHANIMAELALRLVQAASKVDAPRILAENNGSGAPMATAAFTRRRRRRDRMKSPFPVARTAAADQEGMSNTTTDSAEIDHDVKHAARSDLANPRVACGGKTSPEYGTMSSGPVHFRQWRDSASKLAIQISTPAEDSVRIRQQAGTAATPKHNENSLDLSESPRAAAQRASYSAHSRRGSRVDVEMHHTMSRQTSVESSLHRSVSQCGYSRRGSPDLGNVLHRQSSAMGTGGDQGAPEATKFTSRRLSASTATSISAQQREYSVDSCTSAPQPAPKIMQRPPIRLLHQDF